VFEKGEKMENKIISGLMLALVAGLVVTPALARATKLSEFPGFLAKVENGVSTPNYYIVVGDNAAPIDVVGAIDVASTLASALSYQEKSVPGVTTTEVNGHSQEVTLGGNLVTTAFTQTRVPYFWRGKITYSGDEYTTYEKVLIDSNVKVENDYVKYNGTLYLDLSPAQPIKYAYIFATPFDKALSIEKPLKIKLFGQEYQITNFTDSSITILTGVVGTADATTPVEYEGYKFYAVDGETGKWVKIQVTDSEGNVLATDIYDVETGTPVEFTLDGKTIKVKALSVYASSITSTITAKLVVGEEVDKTIDEGTSSDSEFPEDNWYLVDVGADASGLHNITIAYIPSEDEEKYLKFGEKVVAPNDYFEVGLYDLAVKSFATLTFEPVTDIDVVDEAGNTVAENLYGLKIAADYPVFNNEEYSTAYFLLNASHMVIAYSNGDEIYVASGYPKTIANGTEQISGSYDTTDFTINFQIGVVNDKSLDNVTITVGGTDTITLAYRNTTTEVKLGSNAEEAEASDVIYDGTGVGEKEFTIVADYGTEIVDIKANADSDKVVLKVPAEQQKGLVYVGKLGSTVSTGGTYKEAVTITSPVAKLASEVNTATLDKDLILVGGPCANPLVQQLVDDGKLDETYTCAGGTPGEAWKPNTAYIIVVDDAFNGHRAMVVAGTMGTDTRVACSALQNYDTYLSGIESNAVKIDTTVAASPVVTAL